jgi:hypothetical protein
MVFIHHATRCPLPSAAWSFLSHGKSTFLKPSTDLLQGRVPVFAGIPSLQPEGRWQVGSSLLCGTDEVLGL